MGGAGGASKDFFLLARRSGIRCISLASGIGIPLNRGCMDTGLLGGTASSVFMASPPSSVERGTDFSGKDSASADAERKKPGRFCASELAIVIGGRRLMRLPFFALSSNCFAKSRP